SFCSWPDVFPQLRLIRPQTLNRLRRVRPLERLTRAPPPERLTRTRQLPFKSDCQNGRPFRSGYECWMTRDGRVKQIKGLTRLMLVFGGYSCIATIVRQRPPS